MSFQRSILSQDTVVTINGLSRINGGSDADIVNIDTVTTLLNPEGQEITLVLPSVTDDPQKAYIRTLDELENKSVFQPPVPTALIDSDMPEDQRKLLEEAIAANKEQWEKIREMSASVQLTKIQLKPNDQELKFFLHKSLLPDANGIYELSFIAPFSNMQPEGRFTMSLVIILPRDAKPVGLPEVMNPTGGPLPELRDNASRCGRHIFQYWMQQDPIFKVRYQY
jgi:hypothetical protein